MDEVKCSRLVVDPEREWVMSIISRGRWSHLIKMGGVYEKADGQFVGCFTCQSIKSKVGDQSALYVWSSVIILDPCPLGL